MLDGGLRGKARFTHPKPRSNAERSPAGSCSRDLLRAAYLRRAEKTVPRGFRLLAKYLGTDPEFMPTSNILRAQPPNTPNTRKEDQGRKTREGRPGKDEKGLKTREDRPSFFRVFRVFRG